jgi:hypothetical protein
MTPTPDEQAKYANPPEADVMELARKIAAEIDVEHDNTMQDKCAVCQRVIPFIARALAAYGDQRAREGAMRAAIRNYNDADEEIIRAKREARAAALEEAAQVADKLAPLRSIYKNVGASIRALAAAPPQSERPPQTITPWHDSTVPPLAPLPSQE